MLLAFAVLAAVLSFGAVVAAATGPGAAFSARAIGVTDGDTITVLASGNRQYAIRLLGIDAPEHAQAFGTASRKYLGNLVFGKRVDLQCEKAESYGRLICKVTLPDGEDICLDQIRAGMAWHYKQYQDEQSAADRAIYASAEDAARIAHRGLWSQPHPIEPQDFRHGTQSQLCFASGDRRIACSQAYHGPVRGDRYSKIYEWPGCPYYDRIARYEWVKFANAAAAQAAGYRPARNCP